MYILHLTPLGDCLPGKRASLPAHCGVPGVIGQQKPTLLVHHSDWSYSFIVAELYWSRENDGGNYLARNHTFFGVTMESRFISELRWNSHLHTDHGEVAQSTHVTGVAISRATRRLSTRKTICSQHPPRMTCIWAARKTRCVGRWSVRLGNPPGDCSR